MPTAPLPRPLGPPAAKARFWDRVARKYAASPIADQAGYEATLRRVQALLSPHDAVLEVGCGTGSTALRLAAHTHSLLATDVSPEMIAIAREKLAAQTPALPMLRFELADADGPASEVVRYDALLAFNLLHLVTDLDGALSSAVAALRPGGLFISKTPCLAEMNPFIRLPLLMLLPLLRALGKAPAVLVFDAAQLQSAMTRHGLVVEAVERHGSKGKDIRAFIVARKPK